MDIDSLHTRLHNIIDDIDYAITERDKFFLTCAIDELLVLVKNNLACKKIVESQTKSYRDYIWCDDIITSIFEEYFDHPIK